jgi:ribulose-5-phosphate 4-epimerase/fuculose-1-phosphate aldolase
MIGQGGRPRHRDRGKAKMTLEEAKYEVALASRILALTGLASGVRASMGHVSLRDPGDPNRFIVKGRGYTIDVLSRMHPENMVVCDLRGYLIDGPPGVLQCNEVMIHASVFRARPDVKSVVHAHPPFSVMLTVLGIPIVPMVLEGIRQVREPIPVYPHCTRDFRGAWARDGGMPRQGKRGALVRSWRNHRRRNHRAGGARHGADRASGPDELLRLLDRRTGPRPHP